MKQNIPRCFLVLSALVLFAPRIFGDTVWLDDLGISATSQEWGEPHKNKSVDSHDLTIGGKRFERGLGTHANSVLYVNVNHAAQSFSASVGVDSEVANPAASIEFFVLGDGRILWQSGVMKAGEPAKDFTVNLTGVKMLMLKVGDAGDAVAAGDALAVGRLAVARHAVDLEALLAAAQEGRGVLRGQAKLRRHAGAEVLADGAGVVVVGASAELRLGDAADFPEAILVEAARLGVGDGRARALAVGEEAVDEFAGEFRLSGDDYNGLIAEGYLSGPLGAGFKARLSAQMGPRPIKVRFRE